MNTRQLQYVLTLAREGSFSRAAETLGISQPSLSQYIRNIEKEIGTELFVRASGTVRLTEAGQAYTEAGQDILSAERQLQNRLSALTEYRSGKIVLGISAHRSVCLMPPIVREFRTLYPGIRIVLDERPRSVLLDAAEHGEFDLCLTTLPVDEHLFCCSGVLKEEILLALPADSPWNERLSAGNDTAGRFPTADIRKLNGCDFVFLNKDHPVQRILERVCEEQGLCLRESVECTSLESLIAMVSVGMGAALVPSCLRHFCRDADSVRFYSLADAIPYRDIVLLHRKDQELSRPAAELAALIQKMSLA